MVGSVAVAVEEEEVGASDLVASVATTSCRCLGLLEDILIEEWAGKVLARAYILAKPLASRCSRYLVAVSTDLVVVFHGLGSKRLEIVSCCHTRILNAA